MPLSYKNVADILKLVDSSSLETLEIDIDGMRLVVRKGGAGSGVSQETAPPETNEDTGHVPEDDDDDLGGEHVTVGTSSVRADGAIEVLAPMMGTFYRAPSPSDPAYAEVGQTIKLGDALCLIEVMKLFTTLTADQDGKITEIPAENGTLINPGEVLFVIQPV